MHEENTHRKKSKSPLPLSPIAQKPTQSPYIAVPGGFVQRKAGPPGAMNAGMLPADLLYLQRTAGNQAVQRILAAERPRLSSQGPVPAIQPKLEVGAVDDTYEREADRVAAQVTRQKEPTDEHVRRYAPVANDQADSTLATTLLPFANKKFRDNGGRGNALTKDAKGVERQAIQRQGVPQITPRSYFNGNFYVVQRQFEQSPITPLLQPHLQRDDDDDDEPEHGGGGGQSSGGGFSVIKKVITNKYFLGPVMVGGVCLLGYKYSIKFSNLR